MLLCYWQENTTEVVTVAATQLLPSVAGVKRQEVRMACWEACENAGWDEERISTAVGVPCALMWMRTRTLPEMRRRCKSLG